MKRNRGIWLVIACILIVGIAVTCTTSYFIRKQEETQAQEQEDDVLAAFDQPLESPAAGYEGAAVPAGNGRSGRGFAPSSEDGSDSAQPVPAMARIEPGGGAAAGAGAAADQASPVLGAEAAAAAADLPEGESQEGDQPAMLSETGAAKAMPEISPLDSGSSMVPDHDLVEIKGYYLERLNQLDVQIQQMREEATDATTYTMKSTAEKELKLWDTELNAVYTTIISCLDEDGRAALTQEQQQWMKDRDAKAAEAAKKSGGGTMEGVEYTASQAESTRQRAYDLVNQYTDVLEGTSDSQKN